MSAARGSLGFNRTTHATPTTVSPAQAIRVSPSTVTKEEGPLPVWSAAALAASLCSFEADEA